MNSQKPFPFAAVLAAFLFLTAGGCQTMYYKAAEKVGYHKRDILVDRVEAARDSQLETKEQFASALEQFQSVIDFEGGTLEEKYNKLQKIYDESEARADEVKDRIAKVEHVANSLFDEWEDELSEYSNANLRRSSEEKLAKTKKHYARLIAAMKRAEEKIDPVLAVFRDQVLYLKHNLNARAIASLQTELDAIKTDVSRLIKEIEASIAEADSFIKTMDTE